MKKLEKILNRNENQLKPVYLIYGEEKYLLDEFKNEFIKKFITDDIRDFNYTYLNDDDNLAMKLKSQVNTLPVMSSKRYIVVKTDEFFRKKTAQDDLLIKLFDNFPDTTILLILIDGKIDGRIKVVKELKKIGEVIQVKPPKYKDLDKWIINQFRSRGKRVKRESVKLLEQMFNNELQRLEGEIEKITTYKYDKEEISLQDVRDVISKDRLIEDNEIFSFIDALIKKEKGKALIILNEMINDGAVSLMILSTIIWQLKLLLSVKELKESGKTPDQIAGILKEHPFPVKKSYRQSDNFTLEEIEILMERFLEANLNIVTGKYNEKMALEMAIL